MASDKPILFDGSDNNYLSYLKWLAQGLCMVEANVADLRYELSLRIDQLSGLPTSSNFAATISSFVPAPSQNRFHPYGNGPASMAPPGNRWYASNMVPFYGGQRGPGHFQFGVADSSSGLINNPSSFSSYSNNGVPDYSGYSAYSSGHSNSASSGYVGQRNTFRGPDQKHYGANGPINYMVTTSSSLPSTFSTSYSIASNINIPVDVSTCYNRLPRLTTVYSTSTARPACSLDPRSNGRRL